MYTIDLVDPRPPSADELPRFWELTSDLCVVFEDAVIVAANPAWKRVLGYEPAELVGRSAPELVHPDDLATTQALSGRPERLLSFENRYRAADGTYRWLLWSGHRNGARWFGLAKDITESRRSIEETVVREQRMSAVLTAMRDGVATLDSSQTIVDVNPALCRMLGYEADELIGSGPPFPFWLPEHDEENRDRLERVRNRRTGRYEASFQRRDGEPFPVVIDVEALDLALDGSDGGVLAVIRDAGPERRAADELRRTTERLTQAQLLAGLGSFEMSRDGTIAWSLEALRLFGVSPGDAADDAAIRRQIPADDRRRLMEHAAQAAADGTPRQFEHQFVSAGEIRWAETRLEPDRDGSVLGTLQDITERRRSEDRSRLQARLLDVVEAGVIATDMLGVITHWNAAAERMYGWERTEAVGRPLRELGLGPRKLATMDEIMESVRQRGFWEGEFDDYRRDGSKFPAYVSATLIPGDDGSPAGLVGVSVDLSTRVEMEDRLHAARDFLSAVTDRMADGLYTIDEEGRLTYMNEAAERMLGWKSEELRGHFVHAATHYRRADGTPYPAEECPILHSRRDGREIRQDEDLFIRRDGTDLPVVYSSTPFTTDDGTRGWVVVFSDISERLAREARLRAEIDTLSWLERIRSALVADRFELHAQPIQNIQTGEIVQHELLLRMLDDDGGLIMPGTFLPVAEQNGLIGEIDRWVVRRAVRMVAAGRSVQVNLSAQSIADPRFAPFIASELASNGADPCKLVIEVTETALLSDEAAGYSFVEAIKALGVRVALDDFGTGYGGFRYLKHLPVDYLKIDMEFVADLVTNQASRHVVAAVVSLAAGFGLETVAEGVEDDATRELLGEMGVHKVQGYGIGRPVSVEEAFARVEVS
jgi:PAS domain S-box-containing protein